MGNISTVHAACVQYQTRIFTSLDSYRETIERFAGMARERAADLLVLPEGMGLLLAAPLLTGTRSRLARAAVSIRSPGRPITDRARSIFARPLAGALRADFADILMEWLENPDHLRRLEETYCQMHAELARRYQLTLVAGSCPHPSTPPLILHSAYIFGPDGTLLGRHDQTHILQPRWRGHIPGNSLAVSQTPAGSIGVLIGEDVLFPETARALAGAGAEILVHLAAVHDEKLAHSMRITFQARVIENELFGIECFLVGQVPWAQGKQAARGLGTSWIAGPASLIGRPDSVIAGIGSSVEGLLIAKLDLERLRSWWEYSPDTLRQAMRPELYRSLLPPSRPPAPPSREVAMARPAVQTPESPKEKPEEEAREELPPGPTPAEADWKTIAEEVGRNEELVRSALEALEKEQDEWERRREVWD